MKTIAPITLTFEYLDTDKSEARCDAAYARIFRQAWKQIVDKESTQKYTESTYD